MSWYDDSMFQLPVTIGTKPFRNKTKTKATLVLSDEENKTRLSDNENLNPNQLPENGKL